MFALHVKFSDVEDNALIFIFLHDSDWDSGPLKFSSPQYILHAAFDGQINVALWHVACESIHRILQSLSLAHCWVVSSHSSSSSHIIQVIWSLDVGSELVQIGQCWEMKYVK